MYQRSQVTQPTPWNINQGEVLYNYRSLWNGLLVICTPFGASGTDQTGWDPRRNDIYNNADTTNSSFGPNFLPETCSSPAGFGLYGFEGSDNNWYTSDMGKDWFSHAYRELDDEGWEGAWVGYPKDNGAARLLYANTLANVGGDIFGIRYFTDSSQQDVGAENPNATKDWLAYGAAMVNGELSVSTGLGNSGALVVRSDNVFVGLAFTGAVFVLDAGRTINHFGGGPTSENRQMRGINHLSVFWNRILTTCERDLFFNNPFGMITREDQWG